MKSRKVVAAVTAALVAALTMVGCGSGGSQDPSGAQQSAGEQVVKVGQVPLSLFAPLYIANAKGYFAEEGITLNLQNVKSGQDAVPLASSGQLDVVVAGFSAGLFNAIDSGLNVKVVGSMAVSKGDDNDSSTHLVVGQAAAKAGVRTVADLRGKKIAAGGGAGSTGGYLLAQALKKGGLTLGDVQVVSLGLPDMATALKNGSIDAALMAAPFSLDAINNGTGESFAVPPKGYSGTGVIYGDHFLQTPLAQKFFNALAKGARDLQDNRAEEPENLKIISAATGQTEEQLKAAPFDTWLPNLAPLPDQLASMQDVWIGAGVTSYKSVISPEKYMDASFSEKTN